MRWELKQAWMRLHGYKGAALNRPARGTACVSCAARGHRCEAVIFCVLDADGAELPVCMACADDEPCAAVKCAGQGRESSAVTIEQNVWGEVFDVGTVSDVVHRTPEELGVPRTVPDVSPAPEPRRGLSVDWGPARSRGTMSAKRVRKDVPAARPVPLRVIRGVEVRMPAEACMGAEMLEGFAQEAAGKGGEMAGAGGRRAALTEERKREIVEASDHEQNIVVAKRFGVNASTVSVLRVEAGRPLKPRGGQLIVRKDAAKAQAAPVQLVAIGGQAAGGTADSLLSALAKQDAVAAGGDAKVTLELTYTQLHELVRGLAPNQITKMIAAGLPVALTTPRA